MTSANIVVSQMQLWQDCNDTSTQLVDKTMGEICGNKAVVLVCGESPLEMSVLELWFYGAILNVIHFIYYFFFNFFSFLLLQTFFFWCL